MDPQAPGQVPPAAHCALHAGQPFTTICPRCGTYMCSTCSENGRFELCAACRDRTGTGSFPLRRESWTIGALLRHSYQAYKRNFTAVTLGSLITFAIVMALNALGPLVTLAVPDQPFVSTIVTLVLFIPQVIAQGVLGLGMLAIALAAARGESVNVGMLFSQFGRVGAWLVQSLVMYLAFVPPILIVGVPVGFLAAQGSMTSALIAGVVAGIPAALLLMYLLMGMMFGNIELVHDASIGALEALKASWRIADGQRWAILGCFVVILGLVLAGVLACLIGVLFATALASVMFASLFLALTNGQTQRV